MLRCDRPLQACREPDRFDGMGKRRNEAVALALFDRSRPPMRID